MEKRLVTVAIFLVLVVTGVFVVAVAADVFGDFEAGPVYGIMAAVVSGFFGTFLGLTIRKPKEEEEKRPSWARRPIKDVFPDDEERR